MKKSNKFSSLILSLIFALSISSGAVLAGCANKQLPSAEVPPVTENTPKEETPPALLPEEEVKYIKIGISGKTEVFSGGKLKLGAVVTGAEDASVTWAISEGGEFAEIDQNGLLTAKEVSSDKIIKVSATSNEDKTVKAEKTIIITSKRVLTQDMLDVLSAKSEIAFEGYIDIDLYTIGMYERFYETHNMSVKTAMDGTNWYAEYDNTATGMTMALYFSNHNDIACQVSVSLRNSEEYTPMLDENDEEVSWVDSGLYNNFKGLKVSDFEFNSETWRYEYKGADEGLLARMTASANPYDFVPTNLSLIIEDGEIIGFRSVSEPDMTIAQGYKAIQTLTVAVNYGETVEVPTISKFGHDEAHDKLTEAIANMHALESYSLDMNQTVYSVLNSGYTYEGFEETVTDGLCYFEPYTFYVDGSDNVHKRPTGDVYGYKKIEENLYNTFSLNENKDGFVANRAYAADFGNAKPSFGFAAEIFTAYYEDPDDGTTTYFVDETMCPVASTFYNGVGNDIAMYGIFATMYKSTDLSFTPYVVVKDGHIIQAAFYFYLGYLYGIIEINYDNFNTAELPAANVEFDVRQLPVSWSELTIQVSDFNAGGTSGDVETNALDYLKTFFGDEEIEGKMPFFGNALGDSYGFGLTTVHYNGENQAKPSIMFYYDVPLDTNYSIDSSMKKVSEYLLSLGFTKNKHGEYSKDGIVVTAVDNDLDLMIYVWKA